MNKIQNQKLQVEFNDHVENNTRNLDIVESKENIVETRVAVTKRLKIVEKNYPSLFYVGKKLLYRAVRKKNKKKHL